MTSSEMNKLLDEVFNGDISAASEFIHPEHGRIIETRFDPYHDVTVYEDGYEERYYIGD